MEYSNGYEINWLDNGTGNDFFQVWWGSECIDSQGLESKFHSGIVSTD